MLFMYFNLIQQKNCFTKQLFYSNKNYKKVICENFQTTHYNIRLLEDIKFANALKQNPKYELKLKNQITYKSSCLTQFYWLLWRGFLAQIRDPFSIKINLIQTIVKLLP